MQAWSPTERSCSCGRMSASRGHSPLDTTPSIAVKFSLDRHAEFSVGRTRHFLHFAVDFSGTRDGFSVIGEAINTTIVHSKAALDGSILLELRLQVGSSGVACDAHGGVGLGTQLDTQLDREQLDPVFRDASRLQAPRSWCRCASPRSRSPRNRHRLFSRRKCFCHWR